MEEKRIKKREFFSITLEYTYSPESVESTGPETATAITSNISSEGLGIFTDRALKKGQLIRVFSNKIQDTIIRGEVRWCKHVSDALFRVGIRFQEPLGQPA